MKVENYVLLNTREKELDGWVSGGDGVPLLTQSLL
jgi:hypothetical protein